MESSGCFIFLKTYNSEGWVISVWARTQERSDESTKKIVCSWSDFVRLSDSCAFLSRNSCIHVQIFLLSCSDFCLIMSGVSCVHQTFAHSCSYIHAFKFRHSCIHFQIFVCSCPEFRAFIRHSRIHVQTFMRSGSDIRAFMSRLLGLHQTIVRT